MAEYTFNCDDLVFLFLVTNDVNGSPISSPINIIINNDIITTLEPYPEEFQLVIVGPYIPTDDWLDFIPPERRTFIDMNLGTILNGIGDYYAADYPSPYTITYTLCGKFVHPDYEYPIYMGEPYVGIDNAYKIPEIQCTSPCGDMCLPYVPTTSDVIPPFTPDSSITFPPTIINTTESPSYNILTDGIITTTSPPITTTSTTTTTIPTTQIPHKPCNKSCDGLQF